VFPDGVCDWSRAGPGQTAVLAYPSAGAAPGNRLLDLTAK
jgi:hypothetical protein